VTEFLDRDDVLTAGSVAAGFRLEVGDYGLLDAAIARPQSTVFGTDAYPDLFTKAAALMQSLARNHPFLDGNKRTAWAAAWVFLSINGIQRHEPLDVDVAELMVEDVATRDQSVVEIGVALRRFAETPHDSDSA